MKKRAVPTCNKACLVQLLMYVFGAYRLGYRCLMTVLKYLVLVDM